MLENGFEITLLLFQLQYYQGLISLNDRVSTLYFIRAVIVALVDGLI